MKKLIIIAGVAIFIFSFSAFTSPQQQKGNTFKAQNLKILPQDITKDSLIALMKSFNTALGVTCGFCHEPSKEDTMKLNFASDENEHKIIARKMITMMDSINAQYFSRNPHKRLIAGTSCVTCHEKKNIFFQITCNTCHNGHSMPVTIEHSAIQE